jgi:hypothetical protein
MAQKYFRNIPNFEYVDRTKDGQNISDYTEVKNLFKRGKLREDIFQDLTYFTSPSIRWLVMRDPMRLHIGSMVMRILIGL